MNRRGNLTDACRPGHRGPVEPHIGQGALEREFIFLRLKAIALTDQKITFTRGDSIGCCARTTSIHVATAVDIAEAAVADGVASERVAGLASLSSGDPSHRERGLHRWLADLFGHSLQLYDLKLRVQLEVQR